ncbi:hypothetical protein LZ31DRAFT_548572 [Colletotrichum somersetense]|nr:hypothetical protein LZ31DRAFT_548572 [Colletotrichum somersetense]
MVIRPSLASGPVRGVRPARRRDQPVAATTGHVVVLTFPAVSTWPAIGLRNAQAPPHGESHPILPKQTGIWSGCGGGFQGLKMIDYMMTLEARRTLLLYRVSGMTLILYLSWH